MKTKIVFSGLVYLCVIGTSLAADAVDVMGISTGMPTAELKQLLQSKNWRCDQIGVGAFRCHAQDSADLSIKEINIRVAKALPNKPVISMMVAFSTNDNPLPSLAQKFGKPNWASGANANWKLSNGSWLELQSGASADHDLILKNQDLINADAEAELKQAAPNSTPKF